MHVVSRRFLPATIEGIPDALLLGSRFTPSSPRLFANRRIGIGRAATFVEDLYQRGLDDKIMLIACGEMGRTPRINARGGRDHWDRLAPLLIRGGGLNMGQVIGHSTRDAGEAASTPVKIPNLISTVLHSVFDVGQLRLMPGVPRELTQQLINADPIPGLMRT